MINAPTGLRSFLKRLVFRSVAYCVGDGSGVVAVRTLAGPARGLRFRLNLAGNYEMGYFTGSYERDIADRLNTLVKPGWVVWEVGVYIGYYTCLLAKLVGSSGKVVAIEADSRNLARARQNVEMNGFTNVAFISNAIGIPDQEMVLFLNDGSNSHLAGAWIGAKKDEYDAAESRDLAVKVTCKGLDQLLSEEAAPNPDLIKLDIDGAELWAFRHVEKLVSTIRPIFLVELHNPQCDEAAWQFAVQWNYRIANFSNGEIFTDPRSVHGTVLLTPRQTK